MKMKNDFMQFEKVSDEVTELRIYGDIRKPDFFEIVFEIESNATSALSFSEALKEVDTETLLVRINSNGGVVNEGLAIYSQLQDFKGKVITKVDGFAASAASVIFMAGEERIVPTSGLLMIHNAWISNVSGNSEDLRKYANDLDKITEPSVNIYVEKTNLDKAFVQELMDEETWITSNEAVEWGFATETEQDEEATFQQNALLSVIKENKALKEKLNERNPVVMGVDFSIAKFKEMLNETLSGLKLQQEEPKPNAWDKFFNKGE